MGKTPPIKAYRFHTVSSKNGATKRDEQIKPFIQSTPSRLCCPGKQAASPIFHDLIFPRRAVRVNGFEANLREQTETVKLLLEFCRTNPSNTTRKLPEICFQKSDAVNAGCPFPVSIRAAKPHALLAEVSSVD